MLRAGLAGDAETRKKCSVSPRPLNYVGLLVDDGSGKEPASSSSFFPFNFTQKKVIAGSGGRYNTPLNGVVYGYTTQGGSQWENYDFLKLLEFLESC